jgi:hypothetical protein
MGAREKGSRDRGGFLCGNGIWVGAIPPFRDEAAERWGDNFLGKSKIWSPSAPGSGAPDRYSEAEARKGRFPVVTNLFSAIYLAMRTQSAKLSFGGQFRTEIYAQNRKNLLRYRCSL